MAGDVRFSIRILTFSSLGFAFSFLACGGALDSEPTVLKSPTVVLESPSTAPKEVIEARVTPARAEEKAPAPSSNPKRPKVLFPKGTFPPRDPGPVHERSARPFDGVWRPFFWKDSPEKKEARELVSVDRDHARDVVRRMTLHPHPASRFQTLTLAAFDLRQLSVAHHPGKKDVIDVGRKDLAERAGLLPSPARESLFAIFNGGFQPRHGRWGMLSLGTQLIAPRDDACTVATFRDGTVQIGPWAAMSKLKDEVVAYRQTPPCLVVDGVMHARLKRGDRKPWAGQVAGRKTRRRSVVGLSKDGRTLFFGVGSETEAEVLAAGMVHAGAQYAAQLDINWNWTRLFLYGKPKDLADSAPKPLGALIEDMARDKGEYLDRAAARGFFYLRLRSAVTVE